jgi:adenosylcobinamide-phosphate synthase
MNISIWKGFGIMWPAKDGMATTASRGREGPQPSRPFTAIGVLSGAVVGSDLRADRGDSKVASQMRPDPAAQKGYLPKQDPKRLQRLRGIPIQIAAAIGLDLLFGDPRGWPHITRLTGWLSERYESLFTKRAQRTVALGVVFWFSVVATLLVLYAFARRFCSLLGSDAVLVLDTLIIYQAIAAKDLHRHAEAVLQPLLDNDLVEARKRLSWLVGRDTQLLDESEIARGVIESVAESLTDGIVAPLFWSMIGGAPGALVYRAANTLDSMVGHRTNLYEKFGKASARVDDFLNWLPARFCAILFSLCSHKNLLATIHAEAGGHASPNAGWGESAMAHVLGVRLGGANFYDGELVRGPAFNVAGRRPGNEDIQGSLNWMWRISAAGAGALLIITLLLNKLRLR